ncbi:MAG TPA: amidase [Burkholderiaceae bacterium]|nr:amidase [Burkholderiaceae bacterium]
MSDAPLNALAATELARMLREGAVDAEQVVAACLDRIDAVDASVQAWAHLDREHALAQARDADLRRMRGEALGPLHGVPVGVKDIIDTGDMPTEDGTPLHAHRMPARDAAVVAQLRAAGAVILGKTVTTELAYFHPGKTRNPHNPEHTPGGSSSGSAAAVAAAMVPLAVGTQTNGSVIRPAAFCGVWGFKPTRGLIPRRGIQPLSRTLDQVGAFGRTLQDAALLAQVMVGYDPEDPDTRPRATPQFAAAAAEEPPLPPSIAFVKTPMWEQTEPDAREAFAELVQVLGAHCTELELPVSGLDGLQWHRTIMEAEMAFNLAREYRLGRDQLSDALHSLIERGQLISAVDHQHAISRIGPLNEGFAEVFHAYDAILTPSAPGTAPQGLQATGNPVFCTLWTLFGMPAVNLPILVGENGLPLGVQLVGARGSDARLLRTARWLAEWVAASEPATMEHDR